MGEHSYHQYCPVAHALDLIGDRWVLLIIRDLLVGPKRFVDLQSGLPGIGTNILTARLKGLEHNGIVTRHFLPPPAASNVYGLTEYGRQLEAPLTALAQWGGRTLGAPTPDQTIQPDAVLMALYGLFKSLVPLPDRVTYEIRCQDERFQDVFYATMTGSQLEVVRGSATAPDVIISLHVETLYALSARRLTLSQAKEQDVISLEGEAQAIDTLLQRC